MLKSRRDVFFVPALCRHTPFIFAPVIAKQARLRGHFYFTPSISKKVTHYGNIRNHHRTTRSPKPPVSGQSRRATHLPLARIRAQHRHRRVLCRNDGRPGSAMPRVRQEFIALLSGQYPPTPLHRQERDGEVREPNLHLEAGVKSATGYECLSDKKGMKLKKKRIKTYKNRTKWKLDCRFQTAHISA